MYEYYPSLRKNYMTDISPLHSWSRVKTIDKDPNINYIDDHTISFDVDLNGHDVNDISIELSHNKKKITIDFSSRQNFFVQFNHEKIEYTFKRSIIRDSMKVQHNKKNDIVRITFELEEISESDDTFVDLNIDIKEK